MRARARERIRACKMTARSNLSARDISPHRCTAISRFFVSLFRSLARSSLCLSTELTRFRAASRAFYTLRRAGDACTLFIPFPSSLSRSSAGLFSRFARALNRAYAILMLNMRVIFRAHDGRVPICMPLRYVRMYVHVYV